MKRYRLSLRKLDYISPVDEPAQETAKVLLIKRSGKGDRVEGTASLVKISEELGLVFCWAFTSKASGQDYFDLHGDNIDEDFIKACAEFMADGGLTDEMHDGDPDGRVLFAMPMTPDVAKAFGIVTDTFGFMVALKPSKAVLAKFKSGEYTGVSIAGVGIREEIAMRKRGYEPELRSAVCKTQWSTADIDNLPDTSFLYVEPGGKKDAEGKTTPRSLRHFPYRDENGKVDIDHLRDAIGRIPQSSLPSTLRNKLQVQAEKLLAKQHAKRRIVKQVMLTDEVDGHQHALDLDDPAEAYLDGKMSTSYAMSDGADIAHAHVWMFDPVSGAITIGADSGHTHTVDGVVPATALAMYRLNEQAEAADDAQDLLERLADGGSAEPDLTTSFYSSARAPISTRGAPLQHAQLASKGADQMPDAKDLEIADLKKQLANAARLATLTDAQRAHHAKLPTDEAATFLAKSHTEREAIVVELEKANEVVHTSKDGKVFRKSDDPRLIEMAKALDKQSDELAKARTDREVEILKARAKSEIGHIAGDDDTKVELVRWAGTDEKRIALLKAADAAMKTLAKSTGTNAGTEEPAGPLVLFNTELAEFAKTRNETVQKATAAFCATPRGIELYRATENYRLTGQA